MCESHFGRKFQLQLRKISIFHLEFLVTLKSNVNCQLWNWKSRFAFEDLFDYWMQMSRLEHDGKRTEKLCSFVCNSVISDYSNFHLLHVKSSKKLQHVFTSWEFTIWIFHRVSFSSLLLSLKLSPKEISIY